MASHRTQKIKGNNQTRSEATRKDEVDPSGVYPTSGPPPPGDAPMARPGSWGQGTRVAGGCEDHGESELDIQRVIP